MTGGATLAHYCYSSTVDAQRGRARSLRIATWADPKIIEQARKCLRLPEDASNAWVAYAALLHVTGHADPVDASRPYREGRRGGRKKVA